MCGRYTSTSSLEDLARIFEVEEVRAEPQPVRFNVAPTLDVYAVAVRGARQPEAGEEPPPPHRALGTFRWGLVPSWAKDTKGGSRLINARAEGIATKPSFRNALARRRCIIPADDFYEWQRQADSAGKPRGRLAYAVRRRDGQPMAFAGLWEVWRDPAEPESELLRTCTIVTTTANEVLALIHNRMPVILDRADWNTWLDRETDPAEAEHLLRPAPDDWLEAYPVSSLVNNVANEGPQLLDPLPPPPSASASLLS
jgi:putative SOS response-associated peptidase YedK